VEEKMRKYRKTISIFTFVLFVVSAVIGLIIFFMPHPPRPDAASEAVRAISFGLVLKKTHEFGSMLMAAAALLHIAINWDSLKSYILRTR
jgi:quinol-cytochrome oxidoreductase complex cytochrome b subunit